MSLRSRRVSTSRMVASSGLVASLTALAWLLRSRLHESFSQRPALLLGVVVGLVVITALSAAALLLERRYLQATWVRRVREWAGLQHVTPKSTVKAWLDRMGDPLELLVGPLMRIPRVRRMADHWAVGGVGGKSSRYFLLILLTMATGWSVGSWIAGSLFGIALAVVFPLAFTKFIGSRADAERARFSEQLPTGLDALAAGLGAGLSFPQAVDFARAELGDPIAAVFQRLHRRLKLGWTLDEALADMLEKRNSEGLELVVDGIRLQRQFGGDLVRMLEDAAAILRDREELEREVRAVTSQGRLSGWVIAGLVPVSAGILLLTNPRYIDVLFETFIGQLLMVVVLILQLIGWAIISRLVRIRY